jgi:hypothetical protein
MKEKYIDPKDIKKPLFNKTLLIVLAILFIIIFVALVIWLNPLKWFNKGGIFEAKNEQKVTPTSVTKDITTIYGVELQNTCFDKFEEFIRVYGADYSKCLTPFDFTEAYCGGVDPATEKLSSVNILVILDSSGSMAEMIGKDSKINIAKTAITDFLTKMPQGVNTGLVVYGNVGSNSAQSKSLSCQGIEEIVKLGKNNSSNIISAMNYFSPKGWTPLAGSIDFVKNIFKENGTGNKNYLILVSDGIETCDGNPLISAENLKLEIPGIKLNVIGFTKDAATKDYLKKIATRGGGTYLTASNSADIAKALNGELLLIKKDCLYTTFYQMSSRYSNNYFSNLNCWLDAQKKEFSDFNINIENKFVNAECNLEISKALSARQNDFWYQKQSLLESNQASYKKIQDEFNNQLKLLDKIK